MTDRSTNGDSIVQSMALAAALLRHYNFDMDGQTVGEMITTWVQDYPSPWLRAAVIEALYQGRYKAVSVQQILTIWQRRSLVLCHFNGEFERMVCSPILEGYSLESVAEELAAIAESEHLSHPAPSAPLPELEHGQTQINHADSASQAGFHRSIPSLRPFTQQPKAQQSNALQRGDRPSMGRHKPAIDQFIPKPDSSFCQRLQAMATPQVAVDHEPLNESLHGENRVMESSSHLSIPTNSTDTAAARLDDWTEANTQINPEEINPEEVHTNEIKTNEIKTGGGGDEAAAPDATFQTDLRSLTNTGFDL
ncbi:MAG: hypothetical protein WBA57_25345 [Elainellaceae cyanobacterium]